MARFVKDSPRVRGTTPTDDRSNANAPGHGKPCPPTRRPALPPKPRRWQKLREYYPFIMAILATLLTLSLVIFPKEGFQAALDGMHIFWDIVFPSLLPFFVLAEILLGLGVVHFLGVLLEPLMRPLFNVPGVGAFALSMGLAAGYPMDAVITSRFRKMGLCTRTEGERLLAFTNTADPLFILGAVAVGMFASPKLGIILAAAHYLSSFTVGMVFRFYRRGDAPTQELAASHRAPLLTRASRELLKARREDGRSFGQLMGESVQTSIKTLLLICGFIMLFSVVVKVSALVGITALLSPVIAGGLKLIGLHPSLTDASLRGLLEIDLGTIASAKATAAPLLDRAIIASVIIAWSGLCVHAQVASVIIGTDVRMGPYAAARVIQGVFAGLYTWLLMVPLGGLFGWTASVFQPIGAGISVGVFNISPLVVEKWVLGGIGALAFTGCLVGASMVVLSGQRIRRFFAKALR